MNTHEEYVSIETAKMLKQAGFDWECYTSYVSSKCEFVITPISENYNNLNYCISAPTQAMAMRWLREVKWCDTSIACVEDDGSYIADFLLTTDKGREVKTIKKEGVIRLFPTYEQAAEAAIQEVLKIINKKED